MKTISKLALAAFIFANAVSLPAGSLAAEPTKPAYAYVASRNREPFHKLACRWAEKIASQNLQTFKTKEEAIKAGHRPCKVCKP